MDGVIETKLKIITNNNGDIFHGLKKSEDSFGGFGEAYFSSINNNSIKGWKLHRKMTLNLIVPVGEVEFVIFNEINDIFLSKVIGKSNYSRLTISPGLWVAFKGLDTTNLVLNIANIEHDPNESFSKSLAEIPYF